MLNLISRFNKNLKIWPEAKYIRRSGTLRRAESWGRGTFRAANLPEPLFTEHNGVITTTIFGFEVNNAGDNVGGNLSKTSRFILKEMNENPRISISELAKILNIHIHNIEKNIAQLKENKIIERIGNPKKGYWKINNK